MEIKLRPKFLIRLFAIFMIAVTLFANFKSWQIDGHLDIKGMFLGVFLVFVLSFMALQSVDANGDGFEQTIFPFFLKRNILWSEVKKVAFRMLRGGLTIYFYSDDRKFVGVSTGFYPEKDVREFLGLAAEKIKDPGVKDSLAKLLENDRAKN